MSYLDWSVIEERDRGARGTIRLMGATRSDGSRIFDLSVNGLAALDVDDLVWLGGACLRHGIQAAKQVEKPPLFHPV